MKPDLKTISVYLLLLFMQLGVLYAQNNKPIRPIAPLDEAYQAQILPKKTSYPNKGLSLRAPAYIFYVIDEQTAYGNIHLLRNLRPEDIKSIEQKHIGKDQAGCGPPYTLIKVATKNPVTFRQGLRYQSQVGLGTLYQSNNNSTGFAHKHSLNYVKRVPRYEIVGHGEFLNYTGSKTENHFRSIDAGLSLSQNNLYDYKLQLGGIFDLNHMSRTYDISDDDHSSYIFTRKFFSYLVNPTLSLQVLPFLQAKMEFKKFVSDNYSIEKLEGEELQTAVQFDHIFQKKHHLVSSFHVGKRWVETYWSQPYWEQMQQFLFNYTYANSLTWEFDYWQNQYDWGAYKGENSYQYLTSSLSFLSKEIHLRARDSSKYQKQKTRFEVYGRAARLQNFTITSNALELGSKLLVKGNSSSTFGISYRFSDIQQPPNIQFLGPEFFLYYPNVYKEYEQKGFKTFLNYVHHFSEFLVDVDAIYRRETGFAREVSSIQANVFWRSFRLFVFWENIKGWHLARQKADLSRLAYLSLNYTKRNINLPHIEQVQFQVSTQNPFITGESSIIDERRALNLALNPDHLANPVLTNILLGITVDIN